VIVDGVIQEQKAFHSLKTMMDVLAETCRPNNVAQMSYLFPKYLATY